MTANTQHRQLATRASFVARKKRHNRLADTILLLVIIFAVLLPILWMVQMSFRTERATFQMPPPLFDGWTVENYTRLGEGEFFRHLGNSFIVSFATTAIALLLGVPAAYALTRHRFRYQGVISYWILMARLTLPIGFALPLYSIFRELRLINTYPAIILAYLTFTLPLVIWVLRPFLDSVPVETEDAARIDGASNWQVFTRVVLPMATPGLISVALLTYITTWIEFFYALIFTRGQMLTATVSIINFLGYAGWDWGQITSAGVVIMLPVIVLALMLRRYLINGLVSGAVKG